MTEWSNDQGCEIFFEELVAPGEHGNRTAGSTFSWWCRCGLNRDEYERLPGCVQAARAHIEEQPQP
ncbi:MAG: hypothetical protein F4Z51_12625 [Chloroflexi bacterium]|nr:hypothetical protein [Chloroflexota bacterium]MYF21530.1 hypothetical protein [Chloroflexota bacterium]